MCSSTDLCGQLLEAVLLDADKHTIFCKWGLRSIYHVLRHVRQSFSFIAWYCKKFTFVCETVDLVWFYYSLKPWVKHTKVNFFSFLVPPRMLEQTKKTDQTCHTYRYLRQVLLISKEIHPAQNIRCKSKTLKLMRCTQPLSYNAYLFRDRLSEIFVSLCSAYVFPRPRRTLWLGQRVRRGNAIMKLKGCFAETRSWQQGRSKYCCLVGVPSSHPRWMITDAFLLRRRRIRKIDYTQADEDYICWGLSSGGTQGSPTNHIFQHDCRVQNHCWGNAWAWYRIWKSKISGMPPPRTIIYMS